MGCQSAPFGRNHDRQQRNRRPVEEPGPGCDEYAQIALGKTSQQAGLFLLYFFIGFVVAAQIGGRMLDRIGAKRPVVVGCGLAAVGFWLWAGKVTGLSLGTQVWWIILAGAGMGMMLGPASTDAVNRASRLSYGEATGITQTVRNYAASLGIAILGTILVDQMRSRVTTSLTALGVPSGKAAREAASLSQSQGGHGSIASIPHFVRLDFAYSIRTVLYVMAGIMAVAAVAALLGLRAGAQQETDATGAVPDQASTMRTGTQQAGTGESPAPRLAGEISAEPDER